MAVGDLKDVKDALVIEVQLGATTTKGQVVHLEADGKWDPVADADKGKFGVALDAGVDTDFVRVCIKGEVEVTATAAAIAKGAVVMAGTTGLVAAADFVANDEGVGTAMTAFTSGGTGTIYVGLVS